MGAKSHPENQKRMNQNRKLLYPRRGGAGLSILGPFISCFSRLQHSLFLCIRLVLVFLALMVGASQAQESLEIWGKSTSKSFDADGKEVQAYEHSFKIKRCRDTWSMRVDDLHMRAKNHDSWDYSEAAFDGRDLYRVEHFPDEVKNRAKVPFAYGLYGNVGDRWFPHQATPLEKIVWFSLCINNQTLLSVTNFPPITPNIISTNITSIEVTPAFDGKTLAKSVKVFIAGILLRSQGDLVGKRLKMPAPFERGYCELEIENSFSDEGSLSLVPNEVAVTFYGVDLSGNTARRYPATKVSIFVEAVKTNTLPIKLPDLSESAVIVDSRFTNKNGGAFHYLEQSGVWVMRSDKDPVGALETKAKLPKYGAGYVEPPSDVKPASRWSRVAIISFSIVSLSLLGVLIYKKGSSF